MPSVFPEMSARYELVSANGYRAVFNDPSDPDYIGPLTDHSGFDSPEIREETENRPLTDGGLHGIFLMGRRPLTLTGKVLNPLSTLDRGQRLEKLENAVLNCLRQDGTLKWTLSTGQTLAIKVRTQQALRITGAWQKEFQVAMVAADPRFYSADSSSVTATNWYAWNATIDGANFTAAGPLGIQRRLGFPRRGSSRTLRTPFSGPYYPDGPSSTWATDTGMNAMLAAECYNDGNTPTTARIYLNGTVAVSPYNRFFIRNHATDQILLVNGASAGMYIIDMATKTIKKDGSSDYANLDQRYSGWFDLKPGLNPIVLYTPTAAGIDAATTMIVSWQNAWV